MKKLGLLLGLALACTMGGCGARDEAQPAPPAAATPPATSEPAKPASAEELKELKEAAAANQESAGEEVDPGDASLERLAALPESAQLPGGRWKAGQHYRPIVPAQSTTAEPGQVEILEVFWLGCPHCYSLEPRIQSWKKNKPAYVKFVGEHVMWGPAHRSHARLFYTLQVLGKSDELVPKAFEEIHHKGNMLVAADDSQSQRLRKPTASARRISSASTTASR
jgi:thiol:disulfide interchange protein DsbA